MKKSSLLGLAFLLVAALSFLLAAVDVTGDWDFTTKFPNRPERTVTITFAQTGENLTVKMPGRQGAEVTGTGTVKGSDIEWKITRTRPDGQEFTTTYKGKVEGDKMTGTVEMMNNQVEWTAVRKAK
jgi:hypothetical protein